MASLLSRCLRVKSIDAIVHEAQDETKEHLSRTLNLKDVIALGIGAVVGSGIFVTVGLAAAGSEGYVGAGPAVCLSFVLVAIASFFCALCYAELASMIPISGSAYTYVYATLGEYIAWIVGWNLVLEYSVGNIATAISWGSYFGSLMHSFGIHLPDWLVSAPCDLTAAQLAAAPHLCGIPLACNVPAVLIMMLLTVILIRGIRESATFNDFLVVIKILMILFVVGVTASYINPANWKPFMPNGWLGVQAGAALVFYCYVGFDAMSSVAEETKDPGRTLPLGMIWTLIISTILYVLVALVLTGVMPYQQLGCADPMAYVLEVIHKPWASAIVSFGTLLAMTAVLMVFQIGQPRIFMCMARDGLLPKVFEKIHPKFKTPHITTIWCGVIVGLAAGFMDISLVLELCNIGTLSAFILVCLGVLVLRRTQPNANRPFRTPCVPLFPLLGMGLCLYFILGMPTMTKVWFVVWMAGGSVFYFAYSIWHSKLNEIKTPVEGGGTPALAENISKPE